MDIKKKSNTMWKGILAPLKRVRNRVRNIVEIIADKPVVIGILLFILFGFIVVFFTLLRGKSYSGGFLDNILIEAHGLLFDIFVFAILIVIFNIISERKREIKRYQEEIDDYRGWDEKEATFRIVGNIKRLNKRGISKIYLANAYLKEAYLYNANLQRADLIETKLQGAHLTRANLEEARLLGANLQKAYLEEANLQRANLSYAKLQGTNLKRANLEGAMIEDIEQLSEVETLYKARLDPELEKEIGNRYPYLLKVPEGEEEDMLSFYHD